MTQQILEQLERITEWKDINEIELVFELKMRPLGKEKRDDI